MSVLSHVMKVEITNPINGSQKYVYIYNVDKSPKAAVQKWQAGEESLTVFMTYDVDGQVGDECTFGKGLGPFSIISIGEMYPVNGFRDN